jgi:hypothetical protein
VRRHTQRTQSPLTTRVSLCELRPRWRGRRYARTSAALLAEIRSVVYSRFLPLATGNMPIVLSELGDQAGVIGPARSGHVVSAS